MELILEDESTSANSMKNCHKIMLDIFGSDVQLVEYWGPVQMCVFIWNTIIRPAITR